MASRVVLLSAVLTITWLFTSVEVSAKPARQPNIAKPSGVRREGFIERVFKRADRNNDGKISRAEAPNKAIFNAADVNKDGGVTLAELREYIRKRRQQGNVLQTEHELTVDGRKRTFFVHAPKEPKGKLPVVFFFHGGGGRARPLALGGFRKLVAGENFLAVYPQGWKNNWNDGRNARALPAQVEKVDDVKFVRSMVEYLAKKHRIDRSRIFATGASNGGIFSHCLAAKAADLFAGVAPVIGGLAEPLAPGFKPSHPISLLVIQGDKDRLVPIGGGPIVGSERRGRVIATEAMLKKYLAHNGITGKPRVTTLPDRDPKDGTTTEVRQYPPGKDGVRVEYYLVKGGGHTMPGSRARGRGRQALVGKTSQDFNGLEVIWQFFKSCPPRKLTESASDSGDRK